MKVWRVNALISNAVIALLLLAVAIALTTLTDLNTVLIWGIFIALVIVNVVLEVFIIPSIRYARWRYEVTTTEIDIMKGIVIKHRVIVPLVRVQHVETSKGPVLQAFKLASVEISTAGSNFSIPGLEEEEADLLRDQVSVLARIAQEDV